MGVCSLKNMATLGNYNNELVADLYSTRFLDIMLEYIFLIMLIALPKSIVYQATCKILQHNYVQAHFFHDELLISLVNLLSCKFQFFIGKHGEWL
jgi:hypothetical protein